MPDLRRPIATLILALGLGLAASTATADVVVLKSGRRVTGRVEEDADVVRVVMAGGVLRFARGDVERIERSELPEEEVARRRAELAPGDVTGALALAEFAGVSGLVAARGELLELALGWAPDDADVRRLRDRWRVHEREIPAAPEAEVALAALHGPGARIHRTKHWRIAHVGDPALARRRGEMLEAAWRKFHGLAERIGMEPRVLGDRLEAHLFPDHASWMAAVGLPAEKVGGMNGLFLGTTGRIYLYDTATSPRARAAREEASGEIAALAEARAALETQREQLALLERALAEPGRVQGEDRRRKLEAWVAEAKEKIVHHAAEVSRREGELRRYEAEVERYFSEENLASTTHEACHQIAYATGVNRMGQARWLVEGLATLFEVTSRASFVLEAPNEGRLRDVRAAWAAGRGGDVARIVTDACYRDGESESLAYAESWSLCYFLAMRRPEAFARYVRESAALPETQASAPARLAEFRRFFGDDLDALARDWRGYVSRL